MNKTVVIIFVITQSDTLYFIIRCAYCIHIDHNRVIVITLLVADLRSSIDRHLYIKTKK